MSIEIKIDMNDIKMELRTVWEGGELQNGILLEL
jgi:hypothetical protein